MTDIYKFAAQHALRFHSVVGGLTAEQLFHLPLKSANPNNADLDSVARGIFNEQKSLSEESFVEDAKSNTLKQKVDVALEIVKDVIKTKQEEAKAARTRADKAVERKKVLDAIAAKKDSALGAATIEELEKKLAELD